MKVYISGPISGTTDYMERFMAAEVVLLLKGHKVVNPAKENAYLPAGTSWEKYMGESLKMLCECDAIYMMRNWNRSRGAKVEYCVATQMGKTILSEEEFANEASYA